MGLNHILHLVRGGYVTGQGRGLGVPAGKQGSHGGSVPHGDVSFRQEGVQLFLDSAVGVPGNGSAQGERLKG